MTGLDEAALAAMLARAEGICPVGEEALVTVTKDAHALIAEVRRLRAIVDGHSAAVEAWEPVIDAMQREPYSLLSVVRVLVEATEHLLRDHNCDAHGWEVYGSAAKAGRAALDAMGRSCERPVRS